jgi:hypothetical protein
MFEFFIIGGYFLSLTYVIPGLRSIAWLIEIILCWGDICQITEAERWGLKTHKPFV